MLARQRDLRHKGRIRELAAEALQTAEQLGMERLKLQTVDFIRQL
jgi:N-acetylglutamate synthase-like GNAT family acetyltransferase